ncbi:hypothetical protein CYLTODRAFT_458710 [Cylindrobasidium torrendii FP15055 ss-10]|uniref:Uncharacterized protein n=1 Tax=Cylindrobasidium torrendii FP15055 ss-10 TaxID=1314674 RepID=A0A0D7AY14_9AGAR|nr:hypothetical protein CYLTODRAFT_458710 [Cylindrobasidium torrendii FP15055 ss-10]
MHELEVRRDQSALNNDLRRWCQIIGPYLPTTYKDILGELQPWMQEISLECPTDMSQAEFEQVVAFNYRVAKRQKAWQKTRGPALLHLVRLVTDHNALIKTPAPKRSAPDSNDEAEPPAKRFRRASHVQSTSSISTTTCGEHAAE